LFAFVSTLSQLPYYSFSTTFDNSSLASYFSSFLIWDGSLDPMWDGSLDPMWDGSLDPMREVMAEF
jgi:hypothetical protein